MSLCHRRQVRRNTRCGMFCPVEPNLNFRSRRQPDDPVRVHYYTSLTRMTGRAVPLPSEFPCSVGTIYQNPPTFSRWKICNLTTHLPRTVPKRDASTRTGATGTKFCLKNRRAPGAKSRKRLWIVLLDEPMRRVSVGDPRTLVRVATPRYLMRLLTRAAPPKKLRRAFMTSDDLPSGFY